MQNEPQPRVETLFHAARDRAGAERGAYLDGACGADVDLRRRVEALLAAHDEANNFLEDPAVESPLEGPGSSIGPYKLLQEIGEGGMGVVYMAEQEKPVRRKVALKVIKLGMDTKQVIARFEAERQALAMMDHDHIARVLDAGATQAGRPYFVMELVRGVAINEYCDTHKLSTEERLGLFVAVCRAVQHAHQKGIIHRDLKPSNVLITSHDGIPVPKIIDFGVSKATNQKLTERTLFTEFHQVIGTPEYMSPEQAEMSGLDVDTRSDIYALGVILYQLLTGTTPVDPKDLRTVAYEEMTRMIREDEPPAPSTRISKLGSDGDKIALRRGSDAGSLSRDFRGDLDWIVMKALEKDRTRRYDTASAFAADVVRHMESRPVEAGPPGTRYRFAKFVHRNKRVVVAGLVVLAVGFLGLGGTTAGFVRASSEAARSGKISDSLQDVLAMSDSARTADRQDIDSVLETVREVFGVEHATYAAVLDTLSVRLLDAGEFKTASELCRESIEVWKKVGGEQHPNVGTTLTRLGSTLRAQGDDDQAEAAYREALIIFASTSEAAGLAAYDARIGLSDLLSNRGEYEEADVLIGEALAILRASASPAHFKILETLERRVMIELNMPNADPRETLRQVYEETDRFYPEDSPIRANAALGYGRQLFEHDEQEKAEPFLREAVQRIQASEKPQKIYFLAAGDPLFQILRGRDDAASVAESDDLLRDIIAVARTIWGADALTTNLKYYASRMVERDKYGEALDAMLDAHQVLVDAERDLDERENLRDNLAGLSFMTSIRAGRETEVYARALQAAEIALNDEPDHAAMQFAKGAALYRQGEFAAAAEMFDKLEKPLSKTSGGLARKMAPADHGFRALAHGQLGNSEVATSELEKLQAAFAGIDEEDMDADAAALLKEAQDLLQPTSPAEGD